MVAAFADFERMTITTIRKFAGWLVEDAVVDGQIFLSYRSLAFFVGMFYLASFSVAGVIILFGRCAASVAP